MRTEWIEIAMNNGGQMTLENNKGLKIASMIWDNKSVRGEFKASIEDAITSLNSELEYDALGEYQ